MAKGYIIGDGGYTPNATGSEILFVYVSSVADGEEIVATKTTVGSAINPIWMDKGIITASKGTSVGSNSDKALQPVYFNNGTITALSGNSGSAINPVYVESGKIKPSTSTVGSGKNPVYLNAGTITKSTETVGSSIKPTYLSNGTITASSETVGTGTNPVYLNAGTITRSAATVGTGTNPIYLNGGSITRSSETVGGDSNGHYPIYLNAGTITAYSGKLANNISGNADSATKLLTARSINGKSFDGTSDITTTKWGTSRTISISGTAGTTGTAIDGNSDATLVIPSTMTGFSSITSTTFIGNLDGNAKTATTADTAKACSGTANYANSAGSATTATYVTHTYGNNFYVAGYKNNDNSLYYNTSVTINSNNVLMGAAWNDYAEFREAYGNPGQVVCEDGTGKLQVSTKRLLKGANIISDTYGMIIGRNTEVDKPIAIAGRVLAFPDKDNLKVGDCVCSGKNGTVSKMSRLEIILFPDRIIGEVSEFPTYDTWNNVKINDRIWIKVK